MKFCPQCGTPFETGDRFCQQCGFDTAAFENTVVNKPIAPTAPPPTANTPPPPAHNSKSVNIKKPLLTALLVVLGAGVLGTGGWYTYKTIIERKSEKNTPLPVDSIATEKTVSLMDQAIQTAKNKQPEKPKPTANPTGNDNMAVTLLEIGRYDEPKYKNPKSPAKLMLQKRTMIVRITTDHYNDGMGAAIIGTISIKDRDGNVLGTYNATGRKGKNGTPAGKWIATPHLVLDPGTYFIWDSEFATWSKNFVGNGFVLVEGYPVQ